MYPYLIILWWDCTTLTFLTHPAITLTSVLKIHDLDMLTLFNKVFQTTSFEKHHPSTKTHQTYDLPFTSWRPSQLLQISWLIWCPHVWWNPEHQSNLPSWVCLKSGIQKNNCFKPSLFLFIPHVHTKKNILDEVRDVYDVFSLHKTSCR